MNARVALVLTGLAFALLETADIFRIDFPAGAAVFAALFLVATAWFWRRVSFRAAVALLALFLFELAEAPTWHDVSVAERVTVVALGLTGCAASLAWLLSRRRAQRSSSPAT